MGRSELLINVTFHRDANTREIDERALSARELCSCKRQKAVPGRRERLRAKWKLISLAKFRINANELGTKRLENRFARTSVKRNRDVIV